MRVIACFLIVFFFLTSSAGSGFCQGKNSTFAKENPLTLMDCYRLALKRSETIAIKAEVIREAEAHFLQALNIVMPQISFDSSDSRADATNLSSIYPKTTYQRNFNISQTLFSGFKAIAGISGSKLERNQRVDEKTRAEQLLFADVSESFFLLLQQREDLNTVELIRNALKSRIAELKEREDLGRSRHSETVNTQAQLYRIEADFELVKSRETVVRQILEFLTGCPVQEIVDTQNLFVQLNPEDYYADKLAKRPDVRAAAMAWEVAKKKVIVAQSDLFPTVSLEGNYYTARNTAPSDSSWDATLEVNVPIMEGTETFGNIKLANSQQRQAELELSRLKRQANTDIRNAYAQLKDGIARTKAMLKALTSSVDNYNLQKEDYRLSLVSNLDVLDAIRTMGETRRDFTQALYEMKRFYWQLRVATGEIPPEKI
ncbi:MAG: TolC family protein [Candidatus Omnitrophica bacterium]|nr:TolC family protein [Candidatus Omnitrophota bacterium]